ncbi:MAG TPA: AraC family transcriptional regulator [Tepidiformaceae bacterium]|nr:AraC family transcriptional regulator [Tepidiformaceae bacterium]
MGKIAAELDHALTHRAFDGGPGRMTARVLAEGAHWSVSDIICTAGPQDRPFEERHPHVFVGLVVAGSFQYHAAAGCDLLTPGSLMLGNAEQCFECRHDYRAGDRCLSFTYSPEYFERLAAAAGASARTTGFNVLRVPPTPVISPLVSRACAGLAAGWDVRWEDLSVQVAVQSVRLAHGFGPDSRPVPRRTEAGVAAALRSIERHLDANLTLSRLAEEAGLSPYHFLRTFERVTGVTPHQYILRTRLRDAAMRLSEGAARIVDVAFDCGFSDVSNFNHAFRREFGVSPRVYHARGA